MLAYQDIMMGHKDAAKTQLEDITAKISKDRVAVQLPQGFRRHGRAAENPAQALQRLIAQRQKTKKSSIDPPHLIQHLTLGATRPVGRR